LAGADRIQAAHLAEAIHLRSTKPIPHWRDDVLFHEYFHGDHGAGLVARHQTGWTALVAKLIQQSDGQRSSRWRLAGIGAT
jgi:hypothetical protein